MGNKRGSHFRGTKREGSLSPPDWLWGARYVYFTLEGGKGCNAT